MSEPMHSPAARYVAAMVERGRPMGERGRIV
jgi:hypothetical protein